MTRREWPSKYLGKPYKIYSPEFFRLLELKSMDIESLVPCPYCKAAIDVPCKTSGGGWAWTAHDSRRKVYRKKLLEMYRKPFQGSTVATRVRMKEGAPPEENLRIRIVASSEYAPRPESYRNEGDTTTAVSILDALNIDRESHDAGELDIIEALQPYEKNANGTVRFEIVDADGNVWSEEYEVDDIEDEQ